MNLQNASDRVSVPSPSRLIHSNSNIDTKIVQLFALSNFICLLTLPVSSSIFQLICFFFVILIFRLSCVARAQEKKREKKILLRNELTTLNKLHSF